VSARQAKAKRIRKSNRDASRLRNRLSRKPAPAKHACLNDEMQLS